MAESPSIIARQKALQDEIRKSPLPYSTRMVEGAGQSLAGIPSALEQLFSEFSKTPADWAEAKRTGQPIPPWAESALQDTLGKAWEKRTIAYEGLGPLEFALAKVKHIGVDSMQEVLVEHTKKVASGKVKNPEEMGAILLDWLGLASTFKAPPMRLARRTPGVSPQGLQAVPHRAPGPRDPTYGGIWERHGLQETGGVKGPYGPMHSKATTKAKGRQLSPEEIANAFERGFINNTPAEYMAHSLKGVLKYIAASRPAQALGRGVEKGLEKARYRKDFSDLPEKYRERITGDYDLDTYRAHTQPDIARWISELQHEKRGSLERHYGDPSRPPFRAKSLEEYREIQRLNAEAEAELIRQRQQTPDTSVRSADPIGDYLGRAGPTGATPFDQFPGRSRDPQASLASRIGEELPPAEPPAPPGPPGGPPGGGGAPPPPPPRPGPGPGPGGPPPRPDAPGDMFEGIYGTELGPDELPRPSTQRRPTHYARSQEPESNLPPVPEALRDHPESSTPPVQYSATGPTGRVVLPDGRATLPLNPHYADRQLNNTGHGQLDKRYGVTRRSAQLKREDPDYVPDKTRLEGLERWDLLEQNLHTYAGHFEHSLNRFIEGAGTWGTRTRQFGEKVSLFQDATAAMRAMEARTAVLREMRTLILDPDGNKVPLMDFLRKHHQRDISMDSLAVAQGANLQVISDFLQPKIIGGRRQTPGGPMGQFWSKAHVDDWIANRQLPDSTAQHVRPPTLPELQRIAALSYIDGTGVIPLAWKNRYLAPHGVDFKKLPSKKRVIEEYGTGFVDAWEKAWGNAGPQERAALLPDTGPPPKDPGRPSAAGQRRRDTATKTLFGEPAPPPEGGAGPALRQTIGPDEPAGPTTTPSAGPAGPPARPGPDRPSPTRPDEPSAALEEVIKPKLTSKETNWLARNGWSSAEISAMSVEEARELIKAGVPQDPWGKKSNWEIDQERTPADLAEEQRIARALEEVILAAPKPKKGHRKILVSCTGGKCPTAKGKKVAAADLYTGASVKDAKRAAEASGADLGVILSAKHGVVDPKQKIASYNKKLPTNEAEALKLVAGDEQLNKFVDLVSRGGVPEEIYVHGSKMYRRLYRDLVERAKAKGLLPKSMRVVEPQGKGGRQPGIGEQKGGLKAWAEGKKDKPAKAIEEVVEDPHADLKDLSPGDSIYVQWGPDAMRSARWVRLNKRGNPVVNVERVDSEGNPTGEWGADRTFAPKDILYAEDRPVKKGKPAKAIEEAVEIVPDEVWTQGDSMRWDEEARKKSLEEVADDLAEVEWSRELGWTKEDERLGLIQFDLLIEKQNAWWEKRFSDSPHDLTAKQKRAIKKKEKAPNYSDHVNAGDPNPVTGKAYKYGQVIKGAEAFEYMLGEWVARLKRERLKQELGKLARNYKPRSKTYKNGAARIRKNIDKEFDLTKSKKGVLIGRKKYSPKVAKAIRIALKDTKARGIKGRVEYRDVVLDTHKKLVNYFKELTSKESLLTREGRFGPDTLHTLARHTGKLTPARLRMDELKAKPLLKKDIPAEEAVSPKAPPARPKEALADEIEPPPVSEAEMAEDIGKGGTTAKGSMWSDDLATLLEEHQGPPSGAAGAVRRMILKDSPIMRSISPEGGGGGATPLRDLNSAKDSLGKVGEHVKKEAKRIKGLHLTKKQKGNLDNIVTQSTRTKDLLGLKDPKEIKDAISTIKSLLKDLEALDKEIAARRKEIHKKGSIKASEEDVEIIRSGTVTRPLENHLKKALKALEEPKPLTKAEEAYARQADEKVEPSHMDSEAEQKRKLAEGDRDRKRRERNAEIDKEIKDRLYPGERKGRRLPPAKGRMMHPEGPGGGGGIPGALERHLLGEDYMASRSGRSKRDINRSLPYERHMDRGERYMERELEGGDRSMMAPLLKSRLRSGQLDHDSPVVIEYVESGEAPMEFVNDHIEGAMRQRTQDHADWVGGDAIPSGYPRRRQPQGEFLLRDWQVFNPYAVFESNRSLSFSEFEAYIHNNIPITKINASKYKKGVYQEGTYSVLGRDRLLFNAETQDWMPEGGASPFEGHIEWFHDRAEGLAINTPPYASRTVLLRLPTPTAKLLRLHGSPRRWGDLILTEFLNTHPDFKGRSPTVGGSRPLWSERGVENNSELVGTREVIHTGRGADAPRDTLYMFNVLLGPRPGSGW